MVTREFFQEEWNDIVSDFDDLSLMQTWEYAEAKASSAPWRIERAIFYEAEQVVGAVQALVRYIPWLGRGLVWISRGPLWRKSEADASNLMRMLTELRQYWAVERGMYLRILPTVFEGEVDNHRFTEIGYRPARGSVVWASSLVDLSLPIEVLRSRLQQKWRNCLNKAERQGMVAESGTSDEVFKGLLREYEQILQARDFAGVVTPSLLSQLQSCLPDDRKLWAIIGRQDDNTLGGILIARYGKTCEYLVGAVNETGKAVNAGQFLLWRAICQMKDMDYHWFDLGGMDPTRTAKGILHFKKGLSGSPYELSGEIEALDGGLLSQAIRWRVGRARQLN